MNQFLRTVQQHAAKRPNACAYRSEGRSTTYGELWRRSCALAFEIASVIPGHAPLVVYGGKSSEVVTAFLACALSGHAFVPLDTSLPPARILEVIAQLEETRVLACCALPDDLGRALSARMVFDVPRMLGLVFPDVAGTPSAHVHPRSASSARVTAPPESVWVSGEDTAYIVFTSGSTGKPKGIEVSAANVCDLMAWMSRFPVASDGGRVFLDQAHYSFDLSQYSLIGALSTGGCLHAVSDETVGDFRKLFADLAESQIDVWVSTPSFASLCAADPAFNASLLPRLALFLFCGEALRPACARVLRERFPDARIANTYGPTEATVAVTYHDVTDDDIAHGEPLCVGKPRPGTRIVIAPVREAGSVTPAKANEQEALSAETSNDMPQALPAGASGEILIVGDAVAKGYYRDPEKTQASFFVAEVSNEQGETRRVRGFRTGDIGRLDADGALFCEGRFTSFVKVNGYRVELEEVEGTIVSLPYVRAAAVVPVQSHGAVRNLKAFVELSDAPGSSDFESAQFIKKALARTIPAYMIPRTIKVVSALPLTANGKIDRKALAARA